MQTQQYRADQVQPGQKIIGKRGFHLTVESRSRAAHSVTLKGVNGWGEEMVMRYPLRAPVEVITKE